MSSHSTETEIWTSSIDKYVTDVNNMAGRRGPAPLFSESFLSFTPPRTLVTVDLIREFARAHGDMNPLWLDTAHGQASRWGTMIAPPMFEICFGETPSVPLPEPPLRGSLKVMIGGGQRRYYQPIRPGDTLRAEDTLHGIEEKSKPGNPYRMFILAAERSYINQHDVTVCSLAANVIITATPPNLCTTSGLDYSDRRRRQYTLDEIDAVHRDYQREVTGENRRGTSPRWWEDVEIGEQLPSLLKGPFDLIDAVAHASLLGVATGCATKWQEISGVPDICPIDPETGHIHHPITWHFLDAIAQKMGMPYATVFGTHVEAMVLHPVTNWMADTDVVVQIDTQLRAPVMLGEITRTTGEVVAKHQSDGQNFVDITMICATIDGVTCARSQIRVAMPSRKG